MKLYPILFEAARTAAESLSKGIIAIRTANYGGRHISLLSKRRAEKALEKASIVVGEDSDRLRKAIANDATVASVAYSESSPGLYAVQTSAGVNKFGPLAYQVVMFDIQPAWLRSDTSLSEDSMSVWQKMYDLSEKGVYERKWLGDFENVYIIYAMMEIAQQWHGDDFFSREGSEWDGTGDEQSFLKFLAEQEQDPALFGYFWAYRKTSHEPEIEQLFAAGDEFMSRVSSPTLSHGVAGGVLNFFSRRYASNH